MKNTIFWFSGTGNSLYAAKVLARELGESEILPIAGGVPSGTVGGEGHRIGFVFPSYYGDLPRIVRSFAETLDIPAGTDLFAVVTMGALGLGSARALAELFAARGLSLRYGVGVRINGNYVLKYDPAMFGAKSEKRIGAKLNRADAKLRRIAEEIKSGKRQVKTNPISARTLYENISALDSAFVSDEKCTGCGLCTRVCPVSNIELSGGRPKWLHHCEHCVACISFCPAGAINYGDATKKRARYCNPRIKVTELEYR